MNIAIRIVDFFFDVLFVPLVIAGMIAVPVAGIAGLGYWINAKTCYAQGDKMGINVEYTGWTGCMIHVNGTWLPWSEVVPVLRDGKVVFEPKPVVRIKDAQ